MTAKKKNVIEQAWELYFEELKKVYGPGFLDEQMLFKIYKHGALLGISTSEQFHNRVMKDLEKSKLGENHDG